MTALSLVRPEPTPAQVSPDRADRVLTVAQRAALGVLRDREAAADVAQEVALQVLTRRRPLRDPDALDAFVRTTAVRAALREAGRSRRRRFAEEAHGRDRVPASDPELDASLALLEGLPAKQRAALTLRYVHDLPDAEIARVLRCRPATVRSLLHRGRQAVRSRLNEVTA